MMKKIGATVAALAVGTVLSALPVLNPAEASLLTESAFLCQSDCWGVKVGYRGDFVWDKGVTLVRPNTVLGKLPGFISTAKVNYFSNVGVLTLNLFDRIDLYGLWGEAQCNIAQYHKEKIIEGGTERLENDFLTISTGWNALWGIGARATLWECNWGKMGTTSVGLTVEYNHVSKGDLFYTSNGIPGSAVNFYMNNSTYAIDSDRLVDGFTHAFGQFAIHESQVALGVTHRIDYFAPYIAIKWSDFKTDASGITTYFFGVDPLITIPPAPYHALVLLEELDSFSHRSLGWVVGLTLLDCGHIDATVEATFGNERALGVSGNIRF